jgi:hypothetical protein
MQDIIAKSINVAECVKKNAFVQNYAEAKALVENMVDKVDPSPTYYSPTLHAVQTSLVAVDTSLLRAVSKIMDKKKHFEGFRQQALWIHEAWQKKARNVRLKASRMQQDTSEPAESAIKLEVAKRRKLKAEPAADTKEILKAEEVKDEMDKLDEKANSDTEVPRQKQCSELIADANAGCEEDAEEENMEEDPEVEVDDPKTPKKGEQPSLAAGSAGISMEEDEEESEEEEQPKTNPATSSKEAEDVEDLLKDSEPIDPNAQLNQPVEADQEESEDGSVGKGKKKVKKGSVGKGKKKVKIGKAGSAKAKAPTAKRAEPAVAVAGKDKAASADAGAKKPKADKAASAVSGAKKPKSVYLQFMSDKLNDVQFMQIYSHKQRFAAAVEAWNLRKVSAGKAGKDKGDEDEAIPNKEEPVKYSKFHKFVAEKLADAEFLPGQPEIDRKAAAAKEWGFGCSKCKYVKVGCRKCNPQRFADR